MKILRKHRIMAQLVLILGMPLANGCSDRIPESAVDTDGNVYSTVTIGSQVWLAENLRTTTLRNGIAIPEIRDSTQWVNHTLGAYCSYNNDSNLVSTYGYLYNWYAVTDRRGLCPTGWRIPTLSDVEELAEYLGGDPIASGKLKEQGFNQWLFPNTGATNESGFTALPGGYRFVHESNNPSHTSEGGSFHALGSNGYWWTTTQSFQAYSWSERIHWGFADVHRDYANARYGFSVRCIRDKK